MSSKSKIIALYYEQKLNVIEISNKLNVTKQYVSKIIKSDSRHINEKEQRKKQNQVKRQEYQKQYKSKKRKENNGYEILVWQHAQASAELSGKRTLNNRVFRNWNSSIYGYYSKTKEYRIKDEFKDKVSYAAPKKIKWY